VRSWRVGCGLPRCGQVWRSGRGSCCWLPRGVSNTDIAERVGVSRPTVTAWRARYDGDGVAGLFDQDRPGRPREVDRVKIIATTLKAPPKRLGITHWSSRLLAQYLQTSNTTVGKAWRG